MNAAPERFEPIVAFGGLLGSSSSSGCDEGSQLEGLIARLDDPIRGRRWLWRGYLIRQREFGPIRQSPGRQRSRLEIGARAVVLGHRQRAPLLQQRRRHRVRRVEALFAELVVRGDRPALRSAPARSCGPCGRGGATRWRPCARGTARRRAPAIDAAIAMPAARGKAERRLRPRGSARRCRVTATSVSISATGSTRLPRPSSAANHSATIAGKAGCGLIGALAAPASLEDRAIVATRGPSSTPCSRALRRRRGCGLSVERSSSAW